MSQLLQNAVFGSAMILAAALLRRALKDRLVPGARLALWAACLFRLLTPAAPESVLSLWGLVRLLRPGKPAPAAPGYLLTIPAAGGAPAPTPAPAAVQPELSWEVILTGAWLAVGGLLALRYVLSWRRTRRAVACAIPLDRDDPRYAPLPKCARLREGPMEGAPLTFGALRPTVVLSPGLGGEALDCVLVHEGVHAARRDNLWHYAMALALVVHWWNPAVWLMARLLRMDIELSCDRAALNKLGEDRRADYANALVTLATQAEGPAFCHTFGRKAAEERILSIMKFKKLSAIGIVLSLALVLSVTAAFASDPKEPDVRPSTADLPTYVDNLNELDGQLAGSGVISYDGVTGGVFYKDGSGKLFPVDPDTVCGAFTFTANEDGSISATAPDGADFSDILSLWLEGGALGEPISFKDAAPVDPDDVDLSKMKALLDEQVAAGELTREQADQMLARVEALLDQARRGEAHLYLTDGGDDFCYLSLSSHALEGGDSTRDYAETYPIPVPSAAPAGGAASRLYESQIVTDPSSVTDGMVRTSSGSYPICQDASCTDTRTHCHIGGQVVPVCYENPELFCTRDDCDDYACHLHDGQLYAGHVARTTSTSTHHSETRHTSEHHSSHH